MRNKRNFRIYPILLLGVMFMLTYSCKKENKNSGTPAATTTDMEGTWVGKEIGGSNETFTVICNKNSNSTSSPSEWYTGTFSVHGTTYPKDLDVKISQCNYTPYIGKTSLCLYKISNDSLFMASNEPGNTIRPTSLAGSNDTRFFIFLRQNTGK